MLDAVTLDQLRTFLAAADEGSFSAAGRKLGRAQSVVSQSLANLEAQLGVTLFDRSSRRPMLTDQGKALLLDTREVTQAVDHLKARAHSLTAGLEPEVTVVVDVMFPIDVLTAAVGAFGEQFPDTPLRLYVEALGAVVKPVVEGTCAFGIIGSLPIAQPGLVREPILNVSITMVASPSHPLAAHRGPIPRSVLAEHVQLVLTDRTTLSAGREFGVFSPKTWRLADLGAKHSFLRAGLGWGSMPVNVVANDLASGALVVLELEEGRPQGVQMPMSIIYPIASPPGVAGRWLIDRLKS
jgi:DNA-binding transcriptional LysR family regulator